MWKDTLLQTLLALLPVFMFMIWCDRPERTRYAPLFMSIACGITMLITSEYTRISEHGQTFDLRSAMLLIGSLYGGVPAAALLTVLYSALRIPQYDELWEYAKLGGFLLVFLPFLFIRTASFHQRDYTERMKQVILLSAIPLAFFIASNLITLATHTSANLHYNMMMVVFYAVAFMFVTYGTAHLAEVTYERVRMQSQLRIVSQKYLNEMHRLQQLIDHTPLSVAVFDSRGVLTRINEEALKQMHPLTRKDLIGKDISAIYSNRDKPLEVTPVEKIMQGEEKVTEIVVPVEGRTTP